MKFSGYHVNADGDTVHLTQHFKLTRDEYQAWLDEHQADPSSLEGVIRSTNLAVAEDKPKRKRRTKAEIEADKAAAAEAEEAEAEEAEVEEEPEEEEAPKRGGRRGKGKAAPEPEEEAEEEAPKRGGRRGKGKAAPEPEEEEAEEEEAESDITDSDLTKACSAAAKKIKPAGVKDIIASYDVKKVGELKGDDRQAFIDELDAAVASTEEEGEY